MSPAIAATDRPYGFAAKQHRDDAQKPKQVMNAVTRVKLPPNAPTKNLATSGPKFVIMRALPVQNPTAVERMWVGNSSGR